MTSVLSTTARHSSESVEHYSPAAIVEAARVTLGHIDLDPASCAFANELVGASQFFDAEQNGFKIPWQGRIFLNPPGGSSDDQERPVKPKCRKEGTCGLPPGHTHEGVESSAKKWWFKLAQEFASGCVTHAIFIGFSLEILQTTQNKRPDGLAIPLEFPICFPSSRVAYDRDRSGVRTKGASPPHASFIFCLTTDDEVKDRFAAAFSPFGMVLL